MRKVVVCFLFCFVVCLVVVPYASAKSGVEDCEEMRETIEETQAQCEQNFREAKAAPERVAGEVSLEGVYFILLAFSGMAAVFALVIIIPKAIGFIRRFI
jgi:hypothetical protein